MILSQMLLWRWVRLQRYMIPLVTCVIKGYITSYDTAYKSIILMALDCHYTLLKIWKNLCKWIAWHSFVTLRLKIDWYDSRLTLIVTGFFTPFPVNLACCIIIMKLLVPDYKMLRKNMFWKLIKSNSSCHIETCCRSVHRKCVNSPYEFCKSKLWSIQINTFWKLAKPIIMPH